jgi:enediyne biosynthesis protein E4
VLMRVLTLAIVLSGSCLAQVSAGHSPIIRFEDIGKRAGVAVPHISSPEKSYIIESMSGGLGFIDCDNDGKLDIVTVNGSNVDRYRRGGDPMVTLYRQQADGRFANVTQAAGLSSKGWGMGIAVADFDNDGRQDLYVTGYGHNVLYRNLGNCKFEDVTEKAGLRAGGFSVGAAWGDYDRDGNVDLFVARYVRIDINTLPTVGADHHPCSVMAVRVQCGPKGLPGETNLLFHNRGDGTFEEVSKKAGVSEAGGAYGMQPIWFDYNNDGWPDLFVANDVGANFLYRNKGDGTFEDVSLISGAALDEAGRERGSMGVDAADFDHDGQLDLFVTTFGSQPDALYRNRGAAGFTDVESSAHLALPTYPYVGWGTAFFDVDNDGWSDILVANGYVYPQVESIPGAGHYLEPIQLFRNQHDGTFEDVSGASGLGGLPLLSRRGAAFGDINNDGKIDVLILNVDDPPTLLINRSRNANHAVIFSLVGSKSNRSGIGARVTVTAGDLKQFNEVRGGSSYLSQNDLRLHFGLENRGLVNVVEVAWPSGAKETYRNLPADYIYTIVEGSGVERKIPFMRETSQTPAAANLE